MKVHNNFRNTWIWQAPRRPLVTGLLILVPIVVAIILYPYFGAMAFIALPPASAGVLHWVIYGWVARRVARLYATPPTAEGKVADALIVKGFIQWPGIVVLGATEIHLIPIIGAPVTLPLDAIVATKETRWFNGSYRPWKTGFWLTVPGEPRLGFAVSSALADKWRERLFPA